MDKFIINGPCKVNGEVKISGSKNASLPILASTLLFDKTVEIKNLPNVKDIDTMLKLLESFGLKVFRNKRKNSVKIEKKNKILTLAPYSLVKTMRAGILVLGPLIAKYKKATTSLPGGCLIGARPVNHHLSALKKLGMQYYIKKGYIYAKVEKNLKGSQINFSQISVGATENLIMASCLSEGETILRNCAIEPEIKDLVNFLNKGGAKIKWIGKRTIKVLGVKSLNSVKYKVMGDRIECGTFCVTAAVTSGKLIIKGFDPKLISTELSLLKKVGAKIKTDENKISIKGPKEIKNLKNVVTKEYPNFPTDLQAQFMVLLSKGKGISRITENIFENRFVHVGELRRLGAKINVKKNTAIIEGINNLQAAELMSSDLRASVALVIAALVAKGKSIIYRIYHLDRGYENLEIKLQKIGAKIKRVR